MQIIAEIKGIDALETNLDKTSQTSLKKCVNALNVTALTIQNQLKTNTQAKGAVATRLLLDSWSVKPATENKLEARVGTHLAAKSSFSGQSSGFPYAEVVENGAKPHYPPTKPLIAWAKTKFHVDNDNAYRVALGVRKKIGRSGIQGRGIFKQSTANAQNLLDREVKRIKSEIERQWGN